MKEELMEKFKNSDIEDDIKKFILDFELDKFIFGGGRQARVLVDILRGYEINLSGIIISDNTSITEVFPSSINIYHIGELAEEKKQKAFILSGINEERNDEIATLLLNRGFKKVFFSNNWNKVNDKLRQIYLEYYLQTKKVINLENEIRFQDTKHKINFKIAKILTDKSYMSMLVGEWNDIVAPSIFNDYSIITEGAYEWGDIVLQSGDIVFDLGANIGMFSCVAAAKGCEVYAFEPTKSVLKSLEYNRQLNREIHICEYAVGNENGTIKFYENSLVNNYNTGCNSIFKRYEDYIETVVEEITLDTFVEKYHIERVDFIKADIEGAERNMLQGAQEVLKTFAPKLALCTYHLPDDPEVLEQLILQANPDYKIEHKWKKIYAYVP